MKKLVLGFLSFSLFVSVFTAARSEARITALPQCDSKTGAALAIDNARVINLKTATPNQFLERARVEGKVTRIFPSRPEHAHFEIALGAGQQATLEVVFNLDFGSLSVKVGDLVEACGDYITSNAPTDKYQASPSGAIIHWVHENSRGGSHPHGYVFLNHKLLYGWGKQPSEIEAQSGDKVEKPGPTNGGSDVGPQPPQSKPEVEQKRPEKKVRRPSDGKDDPEYEDKPRHGRNWRDWIDQAKS